MSEQTTYSKWIEEIKEDVRPSFSTWLDAIDAELDRLRAENASLLAERDSLQSHTQSLLWESARQLDRIIELTTTWTDDRPTEAGEWYSYRESKTGPYTIIYVYQCLDGKWMGMDDGEESPLEWFHGQWSDKPIANPQEPTP